MNHEADKPLLLLNVSHAIGAARRTRERMGWPECITLVALFIAYTNAAVIAVRFHGLPVAGGAALMLLPAVPLGYYLLWGRQKVVFSYVLPLVALFVFLQLIAASMADRPEVASQIVVTSIVEGLLLFFLITNVIRTPTMLRRAVWTLLFAGAFLGGLSLYQQVTGSYDNDFGGFAQMSNSEFRTGEFEGGEEITQLRLAGPVGEKNRYAQVMQMLIPLGLCLIWGEQSRRLRWLAGISTVLITAGMVLTFSRGAAVGMMVLILAMVYLGRLRVSQVGLLAVGVACLGLLMPGYVHRVATLGEVTDLFASSAEAKAADGSAQSRLTEMLAAGMVFLDHPLIGAGPGMFRYHYREYAEHVGLRLKSTTRRAHCLYLELAADNGMLGLLCFLATPIALLLGLARVRRYWQFVDPRQFHLATGLMLVILSYLTTGIFLHFAYVRYFWLMIALAAAAVRIGEQAAQRSRLAVPMERR